MMPVIFIGHGSPMNAIENNDFTKSLKNLSNKIPKPKAILCISAHWLTEGSFVTMSDSPAQIYDFYGFPEELYNIVYPVSGCSEIAKSIIEKVKYSQINSDENESSQWGIDHGTWSVLKHLYPKADIPCVQLSINYNKSPEYHYELGKALQFLREENVLIIGSGNIVHNLRIMKEKDAEPFDWNIKFDEWIKSQIISGQCNDIINYKSQGEIAKLSVPTPDHFYPLLYVLGARKASDKAEFFYEGYEHASLSMRGVYFNS